MDVVSFDVRDAGLHQLQEQGEGEISPEVSVDSAVFYYVSPHALSLGQVVSKLTINTNFINNPSTLWGEISLCSKLWLSFFNRKLVLPYSTWSCCRIL